MFAAVLLSVIPTIWGFLCGWPILRRFESYLVRVFAAWFFGQFTFVWWCLGCSTLISPYTDFALTDSAHLGLAIFSLGTLYSYARSASFRSMKSLPPLFWEIPIVCACTLIAFLFYRHHLFMVGDTLWRSSLYWDFAGQFSMVQTFIWGNNFPPANDLMAGAPLAYHYMFFLWVAVYGAAGLSLVGAINFISVVAFSAVLVLVAGVTQEFTRSRLVSTAALILGLSTSSLKWLDLLVNGAPGESLATRVLAPFVTSTSPDFVALTTNKRFGYNGNMFNLFYFLEERQLTAGCIILLLSAVVLLRCSTFSRAQAALTGIAFGLTAQWHVYCLISVGAAACVLLLWEKQRRNLCIITSAIAIVAGAQLLALRMDMVSGEYTAAFFNVPRFDFRFPSVTGKYPLTFSNALLYWVFALGPKIILVPAGLLLLSRHSSRHLKVIVAIIVPAFIFTNSIRLAPLSIYDNHKWIRPALLLSEIATAAAVVHLIRSPKLDTRLMGWFLFPLLIFSGLLEGYGYFRTQKKTRFGKYPSELTSQILTSTHPTSVFVSSYPVDVLLAGRRMYFVELNDIPGNARMDHNFFELNPRRRISSFIKSSKSLSEFCSAARGTPIDYAAMDLLELNRMSFLFQRSWCFFPPVMSGKGQWVKIVDWECACSGRFPTMDSPIALKGIG